VAHKQYVRNAVRILRQFDDRALADIGMRRGDIESVVRNGPTGIYAKDSSRTRPAQAAYRCLTTARKCDLIAFVSRRRHSKIAHHVCFRR
jgi:Domain of unknown function (DUF1127)